jgi:hypothetical protein
MRLLRTWSGPFLAVFGLAALATTVLFASQNPLARWILTEALTPARVLPLVGLGAAFALFDVHSLIKALLLFAVGIGGGLYGEDWLRSMVENISGAATHLFLMGPLGYLAAGVMLLFGAHGRAFIAPVCAAIFGIVLGFTIKLTDPSMHAPAYIWTPLLIAFWIAGTVMLTLRAFGSGRLTIFGPIFGSWLIAIGLLYGGASLIPKREPQTPLPPATTGDKRSIPGLSAPSRPGTFPHANDERFPQP